MKDAIWAVAAIAVSTIWALAWVYSMLIKYGNPNDEEEETLDD